MKKIISVLLCVALMFTFMTVIASAADGAAPGEETIWSVIVNLLKSTDWSAIAKILFASIQTFFRMIGRG